MIVICEECGKKYRVDPDRIKGEQAKFKCKACNNLITVQKKEEKPEFEPLQAPVAEPTPAVDIDQVIADQTTPEPDEKPVSRKRRSRARTEKKKARGMGLRFKMFLLFLLVPLLLIAVAGYLYLNQMNKLSEGLISDSNNAITKMAEKRVADKARSVAQQCRLYLHNKQGLRKEDFKFDLDFKRVAVQKVGKTGYTSLYSIAGDGSPVTLWLHPNPQLIGKPLGAVMKKALGRDFASFGKIAASAEKGNNVETSGQYVWMDKDGKKRNKFMVNTPIEGTPFGISSTTYLDEFTQDVKLMERRAKAHVTNTRNIILGILAGTILLIGAIVSYYGHRLTSRIRSLTDVAERISVGELEAEVTSFSADELGDLAEAILRMQDSIRLSIERLRRRR